MILFIDRNFSSVNSQDGKGYFYVQAITKSEENKRKKERSLNELNMQTKSI